MNNNKAKTINILLEDGNLNGIINIESSNWNSGELYSAPREGAEQLLNTDACNKYGVYLLLSKEKVYVGQSTDLTSRIRHHIVGKEWWDRVIVLTTSNDSFDHADIDFLETRLIELASKYNHLDCDNKNKGNKKKVKKFRLIELEQYLNEALFLMELIGVTVFKNTKEKLISKALIETVPLSTIDDKNMRNKSETLKYLEENKVFVSKVCTYARLLDNKEKYWMNPKIENIDEDWDIVLNDQINNEIIILRVPKHTFKKAEKNGEKGLLIRKDKPIYFDINLSANNFIDFKSKLDFTPFIIKRIKY